MNIESFSRSKYRTRNNSNDDVALIIPGHVYAVFDGATDPFGTIIKGKSVGYLAAKIVSNHIAENIFSAGYKDQSLESILDGAKNALNTYFKDFPNIKNTPSTTVAMVLDLKDEFRLIILGDSNIRINVNQNYNVPKLVDDVTITARVKLFNLLKAKHLSGLDELEHICRKVSRLGYEQAVADKVVSKSEASIILEATISELNLSEMADIVSDFLSKGIQQQQQYSNLANHPLGFASMNGKSILYKDVLDIRLSKQEIHAIEIFSDGYDKKPDTSSVMAWEECFVKSEIEDFHKCLTIPSIKGSTDAEFSDDRTIISLSM